MNTTLIEDMWRLEIATLNRALEQAAARRPHLEDQEDELSRLEAQLIVRGLPGPHGEADALPLPGKNESERKANLVLALAAWPEYQGVRGERQRTRRALADDERQVTVSRELCRLYAALLRLAAGGELEGQA